MLEAQDEHLKNIQKEEYKSDDNIIEVKEEYTGNGLLAKFMRFSNKLDSLGIELRGIHRSMPYERHDGNKKEVLKMILFWVSGCGGLSTISGFFLGPLLFELSFKDSCTAGFAGTIVGTLVAAYGSTLGPRSGLRQMVGARFQFGWWPAKICALLNVLTLLGWSVVNCVFGGQILASLSTNKVPIELGIVIITVVSFAIAIFGIKYVQFFESFAALPVIITFMLLYVCAGKHFDLDTPSRGSQIDINANWVSFFASTYGVTGTWIAIGSDYYVEFPESTPWYKTLAITWGSLLAPTLFVGILGIGLGTAAVSIPAWSHAWDTLGNGGLLYQGFIEWGVGGKILLVILYISLVSNNILNTYSIALCSQVWSMWMTRCPRYILSFASAMVFFVLAMVGRNKLSDILANFLPTIGYWSAIYAIILAEENFIFRRHNLPGHNDSYDWNQWNNPKYLGRCRWAAFFAALCGAAGAVLGMHQAYFTGPIGKLLGSEGADLGTFLCVGFGGIAYPILRYIELMYVQKK